MKVSFSITNTAIFILTLVTGQAQNFTRILNDPSVSETEYTRGPGWGDYNGDEFVDLVVPANFVDNLLYQNVGNGSFLADTISAVDDEGSISNAPAWGDMDNDGDLDLFICHENGNNFLYKNVGGVLSKVTTGPIVSGSGVSLAASWVDYNNDGHLDLFVANGFSNNVNWLYTNLGGGVFQQSFLGAITSDNTDTRGLSWCDYDNDGLVDLFLANGSSSSSKPNKLYHNEGNGVFVNVDTSIVVTDAGRSISASWGDYNNDGFPDLFVSNWNQTHKLYSNNGDGTFSNDSVPHLTTRVSPGSGSAWGDFDNDGLLDLLVANGPSGSSDSNFLYRNLGGGNFALITGEAVANDMGSSRGVAWADVNNDGFLDLFVANRLNQNDFLYMNNGNQNSWVNFRCEGILSNKSGYGTKVWIKGNGLNFWQRGEVLGQSGHRAMNSLNIEFGLGGSKKIDSLRVEWPLGQVCTWTNIAANRFYVVHESCQLNVIQSCPVPDNTWVTNLTHNSARLNWTPVAQAHHYEIKGRPANGSSFTTITIPNGAPNFKSVFGLALNQHYVWTIRAVCDPTGTDFSTWTPLDTFKTHCFRPDSIWVSPTANTGAQLNWSPISNAVGYEIKGQRVGAAPWTSIMVAGGVNSKSVFGLLPSTAYQWTIRTICQTPNVISDFVPLDTFSTTSMSRQLSTGGYKSISISPNPADQSVGLFTPSSAIRVVEVRIKSMNGQTLQFETYPAESNVRIDVSDLRSGIYLVEITGDAIFHQRLMIH